MNNLTIMLGYCAVYAAWVLVPLLPAILIYRLFPQSDTQAQWKILGVALKAGGASGFYFTILALAFFKFIDPAIEHVKSLERPDWTVIATIKFVDVNKKEIVASSSEEQLRVHPLAYGFKKIDDLRYVATLQFSDGKIPDYVTLNFPEGEGFIPLKKLRTDQNTNSDTKTIDLTNLDPIVIHPVNLGGQNQPTIAGFSQQTNRGLESNERR
jgi:hypothetical protein